MRPQKIQDEELLLSLTQVFRSRGYEGASLKELSEATGLKKASLYHRFPGGKQQMAESVMHHLDEWVKANVFDVLTDDSIPADTRLKKSLINIKKLYDGGKDSCIIRAFSMEIGLKLFHNQVQNGIKAWISAFKDLGLALAYSSDKAQALAVQSVIDIQGSLIVAKGLNDMKIFTYALNRIEEYYTRE